MAQAVAPGFARRRKKKAHTQDILAETGIYDYSLSGFQANACEDDDSIGVYFVTIRSHLLCGPIVEKNLIGL